MDAAAVGRYHDEVAALVGRWMTERQGPGAFVLGVSGPQGVGKTTLAQALCARFGARGVRAAAVSIDDFYLTRAEQVRLAAAHPGNPYLAARGCPGTHDVRLGSKVLRGLKEAAPGLLRVPRYDKGAHHGEGDRLPEAEWAEVVVPLDLVVLEGWMLGFSPVGADRLPDPRLAPCDEALAAYAAWDALLDGFVQLVPERLDLFLSWRAEAEAKARAAGRPAMSEERIAAYLQPFLQAYRGWLPGLAERPPCRERWRRLVVGPDRLPVS